ncbi:PmoA family protein [Cellulophaga sp. F20128]|uniref:DUF6807 domain-containing protein n=1 Tax=Cellulophaga sp. F20128 TaxID=2926413 RepID=UPI001FF533D0|nr:PmoA family protein [Cellulophaga sp. F20128]MCK0158026.1 PmoA family protein [Cellulophaga sp. F20128]
MKNRLVVFQNIGISILMLFLVFGCKEKAKQAQALYMDSATPTKKIELIRDDANKKVDVLINGKLFTSYIYPNTIKKPVLYPIVTPKGTRITRKFPLEPSVGERVDHPHHVGLWFNYGNVNGYDFWNNSDSIKIVDRHRYGTIKHRKITALRSGNKEGVLEVTMDWLDPNQKKLLEERTIFVFRVTNDTYAIDRITTLIAQEDVVSFKDNKEGMLGIRVTRALEHPSTKPDSFTDVNGTITQVTELNNEGVNGKYVNSENIQGLDCWGKRANWLNLTSSIDKENISLAIIDHSSNVGYPTYWHARGYGLFAANPLGQKVFSNGKDSLNFKLDKGSQVTFKHRILVASNHLSKETLDNAFMNFSKN